MTAPLPTPVPEAPCPGGTTVEQCAAMANWASAEAADATARWIELTLYAEVIGGFAAIVAAGFAGAAFVMSRRGAIASEKQAEASYHMLEVEKQRRQDMLATEARDRRARLRITGSPRLKVEPQQESAIVKLPLLAEGHTGIFGLEINVALIVRLGEEIVTHAEDDEPVTQSLNLTPGQEDTVEVKLALNFDDLERHPNTWFASQFQIIFRWRDALGYTIVEEWSSAGTFIPESRRDHSSGIPRLVDYGVEHPRE